MIFAFVPHSLVDQYEALGWVDRGLTAGAHGCHSRVMRWEGEGSEPICPEPARELQTEGARAPP